MNGLLVLESITLVKSNSCERGHVWLWGLSKWKYPLKWWYEDNWMSFFLPLQQQWVKWASASLFIIPVYQHHFAWSIHLNNRALGRRMHSHQVEWKPIQANLAINHSSTHSLSNVIREQSPNTKLPNRRDFKLGKSSHHFIPSISLFNSKEAW